MAFAYPLKLTEVAVSVVKSIVLVGLVAVALVYNSYLSKIVPYPPVTVTAYPFVTQPSRQRLSQLQVIVIR